MSRLIEKIWKPISVFACIAGLWLYLYGCNSSVGGLCERYVQREITITSGYDVLHGTVLYENNTKSCTFETGRAYLTHQSMKNYNKNTYPIGSTHIIEYDNSSSACKTTNYIENLAISGFSLMIIGMFMLIFLPTDLKNFCNYLFYKKTQENIVNRDEICSGETNNPICDNDFCDGDL